MFISGLVNNLATPKELTKNILNAFYAHEYDSMTKDLIDIHMINDNEKLTNNRLTNICGEYPIETIIAQTNSLEIKTNLRQTIVKFIIDEGFINNDGDFKKVKLISDFSYSSVFYYKLDKKLDTFDETLTYIEDDSGRKVKFLKYVKSILQKDYDITNEQFESLEFVNWYNKNRVAQKQILYLILTNSLISTVGMSSYGEVVKGKRMWTSCQKLSSPTSHSIGLFQHILDTNSIICYLTDKKPVHLYAYSEYGFGDRLTDFSPDKLINNQKYMHYQMIQRNIIRLLYDNKNKKHYIALDRAYPNDKYTKTILNKLLEITPDDMFVTIFDKYNSSQDGDNKNNWNTSESVIINLQTPNTLPKIVTRSGGVKTAYSDQRVIEIQGNRSRNYYSTYKALSIKNKNDIKDVIV